MIKTKSDGFAVFLGFLIVYHLHGRGTSGRHRYHSNSEGPTRNFMAHTDHEPHLSVWERDLLKELHCFPTANESESHFLKDLHSYLSLANSLPRKKAVTKKLSFESIFMYLEYF